MSVVYDIETYPNCFSLTAVSMERDDFFTWEISDRRNDIESLMNWFQFLINNRVEMIGFNNVHFDYPVIHEIMLNPMLASASRLAEKATAIITSQDSFRHVVWDNQRFIPQVDLFKINHFDNKARSTSLKALQFTMRSESVEDLPYEPGAFLTPEQMDTLIAYNVHDVSETRKFAHLCREQIEFRRTLQSQVSGDVMNFNDTKIGKQYFIQELGDDVCYERDYNNRRQPRQTVRPVIDLGAVILPHIYFNQPGFQRILDWFKQQKIRETNGVFKDTSVDINGFGFHFGTGGIHGSVERRKTVADSTHAIVDLDVVSLYPSIAIVNGFYPAHLGERFVQIYTEMKRRRVSFKKGTPENAMLKLALNGVYGDSNNAFSPFYDPQYTMAITINGQLLLCMLAEMLLEISGVELIQINTDGVTIRLPREQEARLYMTCKAWEQRTGLDLEEARYSRMWIRDVNNYLAEGDDGKIKAKGAYHWPKSLKDYSGWWHKDYSALVVPMAAEMAMVHGVDPADAVRAHHVHWDFMCRAKVPRGSKLMHGERETGRQCRYYIAREGAPLYKVSPPVAGATPGAYRKANGVDWPQYNAIMRTLPPDTWDERIHTKNKSKYEDRKIGIATGWNVAECNHVRDFDWRNLEHEWYIQEARKLVIE